jgi:hypothetical protein
MRLSQVVQILARRLGARPGRISATASRLQHAGMLPLTDGNRRYPPDVDDDQVVNLFLAAIADRGLGRAAETAQTTGDLRSSDGRRLADIVHAALFRQSYIGHLIIRDDGASVVTGGQHVIFGMPSPADGAVRGTSVAGSTIAAIAAELQGKSPAHVDQTIAANLSGRAVSYPGEGAFNSLQPPRPHTGPGPSRSRVLPRLKSKSGEILEN